MQVEERIATCAPSPTAHWEIDADKFRENPTKLEKQSSLVSLRVWNKWWDSSTHDDEEMVMLGDDSVIMSTYLQSKC